MSPDDEIFGLALERPAAERMAFLVRACAGNAAQIARLEALLRGFDKAQRILASPRSLPQFVLPTEMSGDWIGRYKLIEKIGEGGCGVVWRAAQEEPVRRCVALKVIKLGMDTKSVIARFEAERQALAMMDHPNIAKVFDAGATETGRPYFVMELVRGIPITRFCDDASLSMERRLQLFVQVCQAIQHAHQKGIIHRDIKPSNLLVTMHDDVAVPKVIDFGIAKATQGKLTDATIFTAFEQFIGTPAYMSPEQAEFNALDVDTRSDVYSLGVLLYELLTGRPPFDPETLVASGLDQIRRTIREVEPPRPSLRLSTLGESERTTLARQRQTVPSQLSVTLRGDLDWIVMKALEKDRARRYESASALAIDVQRFLGHEPVAARPPSRGYSLAKLVRRHRVAFAGATIVLAVLVLGAAVSTWQAVRATRAERAQARLRATEADLRGRAEAHSAAARRQAYASDLNLVQQALASHNLGRAQELLNRQRPRPGDIDLRGWEWRYLWQFCQDQASWGLANGSVGTQVSVSSDGHWLATGGPKPGLWNLRTRQPAAIPQSAGGKMAVAQFSPTEPLLAISSWTPGKTTGARLTLWNPARQEAVHEWPLEHPFSNLVFCGDGKTLVTMQGSEVVFRRVPTGERLSKISKYTRGDIAFSHDGKLAARQDVAGTVRLIDVTTGSERWKIKAAAESTAALAFSPDGATLATADGGADSAIRLWNVANGQETGRLEGHRAYARSLVFWPDGRTLASAAQDQTIRIWDLNTRQLKRTLHGHQQALLGLALLPDLATLVSTSGDATLRFWDTTSTAVGPSSGQLTSAVMRWAFTPDSQAVITVDRKGVVRRWHGRDFGRSTELATITAPYTRTEPPDIETVCLPFQGELVAVTSSPGVVQVWNWARGAMEREFAAPVSRATPVAFIDGERKLLVDCFAPNGKAGGLFEWDLATGQQTRSWPRPAMPAEYSVSPDGRRCLVRVAPSSDAPPVAVSFIDLVSGVERPVAGAPWLPEQGRFSPDGRLFAAPTGPTGTIYSTKNLEPVRTLTATMHGMFGAAFSPDGGRLAFTMSGFEAVRLWDTENWEQVLTLDAGASRLWNSAFSPDGNVLGSMSYWGTVHFWRAPSWSEIAAAEKKSR